MKNLEYQDYRPDKLEVKVIGPDTTYRGIMCGICSGPMRHCPDCGNMDAFPLHCADKKCNNHTCQKFVSGIIDYTVYSPLPTVPKYSLKEKEKRRERYRSMVKRKRAEGRCLQCSFSVPLEEARIVTGGVCAAHRKIMTERKRRKRDATQQQS